MTMCLGQKPCQQSQSQVSGPRVTNFTLTRAQSRPSTNIRGVSHMTATCGYVHRGLRKSGSTLHFHGLARHTPLSALVTRLLVGPDICTENPIEQLLNNYRTTIEQL